MKLSRKKKKILRRLARVHFLLTLIAFGFYLSLSFFLGPRFLLSDVKDKFCALADDIITVSARVLAPPVQPVVTATPVCVTGAPRVNLDWADDDNTLSWNIERDGLPLVSGLVASSFTDATVANTTAYSYVVTAYGPMGPGFAASLPVVVTTLDCGTLQPTPTLDIVTFNGVNIATLGTLSTTILRPAFTGTTNIPNASIDILASSTQVVSDHITANGAGYWSWTPAVDLVAGEYTLSVTATDPLDGTRMVQRTTVFTIEAIPSESTNESNHGNGNKKKKIALPLLVNTNPSEGTLPFDFAVQSSASSAYQGDTLNVSVVVTRVDSNKIGSQALAIIDLIAPDGESKAHAESFLSLALNAHTESPLTLPLSLDPKDGYHIRITLVLGKYSVTRTAPLTVLPLPILQLGGGVAVTLPQIVAFSGWIALILLTLLLLWLFLFLREYWLYLHAFRHITERQLIRLGFFGTGMGVLG
ncbi:MAG: Ig-like domain-containing protein [Candidatus Moraniibacteriota bacterium]